MAAVTSAVYVKDAYKHYGPKTGPKRKQVLDGLSMTVTRGSIYGLLGASGCGKTTLLSCLVGRKLLNDGELWVLGGTPGTEGSGVPGPRIGYMPQETALISEFTVKGMCFYFGRICGMADKDIDARYIELAALLDLPPHDRMVGNCSGGQQRRISFAAALVHDPELLILDEPTVGLDPVLRERIWDYLVDITNTKNIAVVITTHYIEECRQAHKIGLMRQGRLLAEASPNALVERFQADTLEQVFLELSRKQAEGLLPAQNAIEDYNAIELDTLSAQHKASTDILVEKLQIRKEKKKKKTSHWSINYERFKALYLKNWLTFFRNPSGVAFAVIFPIIQICTFFLAVGGMPKNLPLAFVNDENGTCAGFDLNDYVYYNNDSECQFRYLSCKYLQEVEDPMITKYFYNNVDDALHAVRTGKVLGVVYFPSNYTNSAKERALEGKEASDDAVEYGEIKVWLDMSNHQIGPTLQQKLTKKYLDFQKKILSDCKYDPKVAEIPLQINDPVYGNDKDSYNVFVIPGFLITVIYFIATMMTSTIFITERLDGVWDRTLVAGATTAEILVSHLLTQFTILVFQIVELMIITFFGFQIDVFGKFYDIIGILLAMGLSGMCYGFLISCMCESHTQANFVSTGSFYPMIIISGVMWPVEAMPIVLKWISLLFPFTIPIEALRAVIKKGWMITSWVLIDAYAITTVWTAFYLILSFYMLKSKM